MEDRTSETVSSEQPRARRKRTSGRGRLTISPVTGERDKLSIQQRTFVQHYLTNNWNGTRAAIAAGYSKKSAASASSYLLNNPNVKEEIAEALRKSHLSSEKVLARLAEMATADLTEFTDSDGKIVWDKVRAKGYLVRKHRQRVLYRRGPRGKNGKSDIDSSECEIELYDSQKALEVVARHLGLVGDRVDITSAGMPLQPLMLQVDPREIVG